MEIVMQPESLVCEDESPSDVELGLSLQHRKLTALTVAGFTSLVEAANRTLMMLKILDLSFNNLRLLPVDAVNKSVTPNLQSLNLSRNLLKKKAFFAATSSNDRAPSQDFFHLSELPLLSELDLRFNEGLGEPELVAAIRAYLGDRSPGRSVNVHASLWGQTVGAAPSDRDATLLRSQLEPWPTRVLRDRLATDFRNHFLDDDRFLLRLADVEREEAMQRLLACYHTEGLDGPLDASALREHADDYPNTDCRPTPCRRLLRFAGVPVDPKMLQLLDTELRLWAARQESTVRVRERPSIQARNYMILRRPEGLNPEQKQEGQSNLHENTQGIQSHNQRLPRKAYHRSKKIAQNKTLWDLAHQIVVSVDPVWAEKRFNELAVTHNFEGSPHIDKQNTGPFYGLSIGDFAKDAGGICVEMDARTIGVVDTHNRLGRVDGRYPHWVAPWKHSATERFSLIFYSTDGEYEPPGPAVPGHAM